MGENLGVFSPFWVWVAGASSSTDGFNGVKDGLSSCEKAEESEKQNSITKVNNLMRK
jgi:hypothetical protein